MKVGDYVRTKTGIHKIFRINENAALWKYHCDKKPTGEWDSSYEYIKIKDDDIIKSSPNIIDLIEVGDIITNQQGEIIVPNGGNIDELKDTWKIFKNIKSIVTKEQFESMEYKIGE